MASVQMNTRLDAGIKAQGDAVLQRNGLSGSQAVRALWSYVVEHQALPPFMVAEAARNQRDNEARRGIDQGRGLALRVAREHGMNLSSPIEVDYEQLEAALYAAVLEEYEDNHV